MSSALLLRSVLRTLLGVTCFACWIPLAYCQPPQTASSQTQLSKTESQTQSSKAESTGIDPTWRLMVTDSDASLRGLMPIDATTVWACGSQGTILVTSDGGQHWRKCPIAGLEQVEFRSLHAWNDQQAIVATAGQPSAIYKTNDGGVSWKRVYDNPAPEAFLDGMRFWDDTTGLAFGDPIDGQLLILITRDSGEHWEVANREPVLLEPGSAAFAASNSSLCVYEDGSALIGLGGRDGAARVLRSSDHGATWLAVDVPPILSGPSSGIFSIDMRDANIGVAVGGDYKLPDNAVHHVAITRDGGRSWSNVSGQVPLGYRSSVIAIGNSSEIGWLTIGPTGGEWSATGEDWLPASELGFHALAIGVDGSIWACGSAGRIAVRNTPPH